MEIVVTLLVLILASLIAGLLLKLLSRRPIPRLPLIPQLSSSRLVFGAAPFAVMVAIPGFFDEIILVVVRLLIAGLIALVTLRRAPREIDLPITSIWGVGRIRAAQLQIAGISSIGDLLVKGSSVESIKQVCEEILRHDQESMITENMIDRWVRQARALTGNYR